MTAYTTAIGLGLTGTDAAQVAILQTLTAGRIDPQDVRRWCRENGLWYRKPDGTMGGTLQQVYATCTPQHQAGLDQFFAAVFGDSAVSLRTTEPQYSQQVWGIVAMIAALVPQSSGLVDSFYSLDGGRPYKDLTVNEFAAQRADYDRLAAADAWVANVMNETIQPALSAPDRTLASVQAAFASVTI